MSVVGRPSGPQGAFVGRSRRQRGEADRMGVDVAEAAAADGGFRHLALFYRGPADYLSALQGFVQSGLARAEPVLVAVPQRKVSWLRRELPRAERVTFADMTELGRNPARIIPSVSAFVGSHAQQRVRYIGEPVWPERSADELREACRHEALMNLAFVGVAATLLCPYDLAELPESVITSAACTHPALIRDGREQPSASYLDPPAIPADCNRPFPTPPADAEILRYDRDLRPVRAMVTEGARRAGLSADRATDLVIAVSEVAANTLRHTEAGGTVQLWPTTEELICQVSDTGMIADPLAGRRIPADDMPGGKGLWLVNQICDLVEVRTSPAGTTIRLHMRLS
jgi:anti-sigma regulatory factor (Ser/Thr protein kinase)